MNQMNFAAFDALCVYENRMPIRRLREITNSYKDLFEKIKHKAFDLQEFWALNEEKRKTGESFLKIISKLENDFINDSNVTDKSNSLKIEYPRERYDRYGIL